jgi:hypothetical protein
MGLAPALLLSQASLGVEEANDRFGSSIVSGDFNGDGRDELAVGVPNGTASGMRSGAVALRRSACMAPRKRSAQRAAGERRSAGGLRPPLPD